jgi:hypothetical protein
MKAASDVLAERMSGKVPSLRMVRMWHYAQAEQYRSLVDNPSTPTRDVRKYELRGILHVKCVESLNAVIVDSTVQQDLANEVLLIEKAQFFQSKARNKS